MGDGNVTSWNGRCAAVIVPRTSSWASTGFVHAAWLVSMALLPVYVGGSGGVQPGHAVMAVAAVLTMATVPVRTDWLCLTACLLAGVVAARCLCEAAGTGDYGALMPAGYFVFNAIIALALRAYAESERDAQCVRKGIAVALFVAVCGLAVLGVREGAVRGERMAGTFNNPNQLGYFSTCASSILTLLYFRGSVGVTGLVTGMSVGGFLTALSLSKAALVANSIGIALWALALRRTSAWLLLGITALATFPICAMSIVENGSLDELPVVRRLRQIGHDSDDSLEMRGYGLLVSDDPGIILFGRGSEDVLHILGHEVHSSIGSIWVGYGAVGGILFVSLLAGWCRTLGARYGMLAALAIALPPLVYGLTHNGTRATIFWVLVAVSQTRENVGRKTYGGASYEHPVRC